jgi:hypothetical protein
MQAAAFSVFLRTNPCPPAFLVQASLGNTAHIFSGFSVFFNDDLDYQGIVEII